MKKSSLKRYLIIIFSNLSIIVMLIFLGSFSYLNGYTDVFKRNPDTVFYHGNTSKNEISIMINVYWGTEYLDSMLKTLDNHSVKATFFVGGLWVSKEPEMLLKIYEKGHEIANHGFYHKDQDKLSFIENKNEIYNNHRLVKEYLGVDMNLFAPPSGAYSEKTISAAKELGYNTILWSKDTIDWRDQDESLIIKRASTKLNNGDLILMHPTKATTNSLSTIIDNIVAQNFKIVKVSQNISSNIV